jgi:predicted RecA/RadA family phage recombinase
MRPILSWPNKITVAMSASMASGAIGLKSKMFCTAVFEAGAVAAGSLMIPWMCDHSS